MIAGVALVAGAITEIEAASEFTEDDEVHALDEFALQRRAMDQVRIDADGADVGEEAKLLAEAEQALFGPFGAAIPFRTANRAEEDGVRAAACGERSLRQRIAGGVDRGAADRVNIERETAIVQIADGGEYVARDSRHFGADAVTRQQDDVVGFHSACPRSKASICGMRSVSQPSGSTPSIRQRRANGSTAKEIGGALPMVSS